MIQILQRGEYKLIETKSQTKILILDNNETYAWVNAGNIGEILIISHKVHKADCILAIGKYRIYQVDDEKNFSDQMHLEMNVGDGVWQGYLLPTGLPTENNTRNRIIPTKEIITIQKTNGNQGIAWL